MPLTNPQSQIYQDNPNWLRPGETPEQYRARTQTTQQPTVQTQQSPQTYNVQAGDTLSAIAGRYGVSIEQITGYRSGNPNLIYPGETLTIQGGLGGGQIQEIHQQQDTFQKGLDDYQLSRIELPSIPDFREDINWLRDQMQQVPALPDLRGEMERLRQQYQVEPLESQISDYDRQIVEAQQKYSELLSKEKERPVTLEVMRGRTGEIEEMMRQEIGFLEARKNVTVNQLNQKYNTINMMMNLTVQEYEFARQDYEMKFNQAFNLMGLLMDNERFQFDAALKLAKTEVEIKEIQRQAALVNWEITSTALQNAIQAGSTSLDKLTAEQKAQISRLELEAGLPHNFTMTVLAGLEPKDEIISPPTLSADGSLYSMVIRDANGIISSKTFSSGMPSTPGTIGTVTEREAFRIENAKQSLMADIRGIKYEEDKHGNIVEKEGVPIPYVEAIHMFPELDKKYIDDMFRAAGRGNEIIEHKRWEDMFKVDKDGNIIRTGFTLEEQEDMRKQQELSRLEEERWKQMSMFGKGLDLLGRGGGSLYDFIFGKK
jgi:LysM repeat protein